MDRPAKKPRLHGPDGFQKSKPAAHYKPPESITKFVSAFDGAPSSPAKPNPPPRSPARKKPVSVATLERPRNPFVDFDVPREPEAGPSKPSVLQRQPKPPSAPSAHAPFAPKAPDKAPPLLKTLKPPIFLPPAAPLRATTTVGPSNKTSTASLRSLQPTLHRPPLPPEKPRSMLKPPPVPVPGPSSSKPTVPLKLLAPPPPPPLPDPRPASPTKKTMKTIFTTSVAQATDPTKEGTGAELLSLFLQQHGHTFTSPTDRELQRGVTLSPDKRSRGKDPKFVRGGLAERFQHRISCTKTDFALWRRQTERKLEAGTKLASDAQLRILRVLDLSKPPATLAYSRSRPWMTTPRAALALCRLTRQPVRALALVGDANLTLGTYVVLLHFACTPGPARSSSGVSVTDGFEQGNEVMVWMPWHRVELAGVAGCEGLLEMMRALDTLTPPHSLLVVSRFRIVTPRLVRVDDAA